MLKDTKSGRYLVPVLMHLLDILELLQRTDAPLKMYEISEATGVSLTTTYRILRTLVHRGYLTQDREGRFRMLDRPELKNPSQPASGPSSETGQQANSRSTSSTVSCN